MTMRKFTTVVLLLGTLTSPVFAQASADRFANKLSDYFSDRLFDPYSAHWTLDIVQRKGPATVICGTVNAKNRYGAYVGKTPFAATLIRGDVALGEIFEGASLALLKERGVCDIPG